MNVEVDVERERVKLSIGGSSEWVSYDEFKDIIIKLFEEFRKATNASLERRRRLGYTL